MSNIKIVVCCHKQDIYKKSDIYMPIHVGRALLDTNIGIQGDDVGENISKKNANYCELTGMYWAWKNLKGVDYIGLCHYRRYFDFNHNGRRFFPVTTINADNFNNLNLDISPKAEKWLNKGGCIVAKHNHLYTSLYLHYCEGHYSNDIKILGNTIRETMPNKYFNAFKKYIVDDNKFSPFNMFIMNWEQFDNYCNWLFPLLERIEKKIDLSHYSKEQKRVLGYMGERLLNLYINAEQLKIMQIPILKITDEEEVDNMTTCKYLFRTLLRDIAIRISPNY